MEYARKCLLGITVIAAASIASAVGAFAQERVTTGEQTRYPAEGLAIIDCDPSPPAPEDSCVVRMPPKNIRQGGITFSNAASEGAGFDYFTGGDNGFPSELVASATAIVLDITSGPRGLRQARWETERDYVIEFIEALPDDGLVAVYFLDDELDLRLGFTSQKRRAVDLISGLDQLEGRNTVLGTNLVDVIESVGRRDDILLKNVVLISDGEDEAPILSGTEIADVAIREGVTLSTMATIWRRAGGTSSNSETRSTATATLREMTRRTLGTHEVIETFDSTAGAEAATRFAKDFATSIGESGLILPDGDPVSADINLTYGTPVIGRPGEFDTQVATVSFVASTANTEATPEPTVTEAEPAEVTTGFAGFPWGFEETTVYAIAAAIAALLLFLLLFLILGRRNRDEADDNGVEDGGFGDGPGSDETKDKTERIDEDPPVSPPPPAREPWAYFVRQDTGDRLPIYGRRAKIGRSSENEVAFRDDDNTVSRFHAELDVTGKNQMMLSDTNSANKTFVNGKEVKSATQIKSGDIVAFGDRETKFIIR